jgi:protein-S-isoprenylcysteine O-methyltransferase Ste14
MFSFTWAMVVPPEIRNFPHLTFQYNCVHGWITLGYAIATLVFLYIKSRREEQWLKEKFPGYAAYQKRVAHKLIPLLY